MKEWRSVSRFPCTADEYYRLMETGAFQQRLHMTAMKMGCYDVTDDARPDGTIRRIVFSEPRLNLPTVLERVMKKAQAYHEHAVFNPPRRERRVRVVPCMGGDLMDFSFHEWARDDDFGAGGCVVQSNIRLHVKGGWFGRILERFIKSTSKVKIAERDAHMNDHFRSLGSVPFDGDDLAVEDETFQDENDERERSTTTVTVTLGDSGSRKTNATRFNARLSAPGSLEESLARLCSHPLPPKPRRSVLQRARSSFKW
jgi:hypothetical protein